MAQDLRFTIVGDDRASDDIDRVGRKLDGLGKTFSKVGGDTERVNTKMSGLAKTAQFLSAATSGPVKFFTAVSRWALLVGVIGGVVSALGAIPTGLAAVPALIGAVGSSIALLPAAAAAAALAFGALAVATSGMGDALSQALSEGSVSAENLKGLAPAAREVAQAFAGLHPALAGVRTEVQNATFVGLGQQISALGNLYIPVLKNALVGMGEAWNSAFSQTAELARTPAMVSSIGETLNNASLAGANLSGVMAPLLSIFTNLATVGSGFLPGFASGIAEATTGIAEFIATARETGQLQQWFSTGFSVLGQIGQILIQLGGIFQAVFSAATASGGSLFATLGTLLGAVNQFLSSAEGMSVLTTIFSTLRDAASQLAPAFGPFLSALGAGLSALAPAFAPLIGVLGKVIVALSPILTLVGQLAGAIGENLAFALSALLPALTPIISALTGALAPVIPQIAAAFRDVGTALTPLLAQLGPMLAGTITQLVPLLAQLVTQLVGALLPILPALISSFMQLFMAVSPLLPSIVQLAIALTPVIGLLAQTAAQMLGIIPILVPLISFVAKLAAVLLGVLAIAIRVVVAAVVGIRAAFSALAGVVLSVGATIAGWAAKVGSLMTGVKNTIVNAFAGAGEWLFNAGKKILQGLINGVKSMISTLKGAFSGITNMIPKLKGPMDVDARLLTPNGEAIMESLLAGISLGIPGLARLLGDITTSISPTVTASLAGVPVPIGGAAAATGRTSGGADSGQPLIVQLVLDGKIIQEALLRVKRRNGGIELGLA